MRKIKIMKWKEQDRDNIDEEVDVNTCGILRNIVRSVPPNQLPTGVDAFKLMRGLHLSLENAKNKEYLFLEDNVYDWLEKNAFKNIPAVWGLMDDVSMALSEIIDAEQYDPNVEIAVMEEPEIEVLDKAEAKEE